VISICFLIIHMVYTIKKSLHLPLFDTIFSGVFFNHQFSKPIGIHAGYLSLYVSLSIFYLARAFATNISVKIRAVVITLLVILFFGLFFLASRNTIIATFFVLIFISPLFNSQKKVQYIIVCLLIFAACLLTFRNIPYLRERFSVELLTDIRPYHDGDFINYSSAEPRYERWKGAFDLIGRSPAFGYGTGDEIEMLKTEYAKRGLFISYLQDFNAHNQYLSYLLKNGIFGLLVFLAAFYYYCRLAIKTRDFIYLCFLLLLLIGFYTENILDANKGILFFALFNTLLGYNALHNAKAARQTPEEIEA
jgi:O-antigen ligase